MPHLTREPIDVGRLLAVVSGSDCGGTACFIGTVRNHQDGRSVVRLEYSAYEPMAEQECAAIVAEAMAQWPVRVVLAHRLGELAIGDAAIVVVASSGHRAPAFEACRYVIEEAKRRVPVWKREHFADGAIEWVDPTGPASAAAASVQVRGA